MPICSKCGKTLTCTDHGEVVEKYPDLAPVQKCNPKGAIWVRVKDDSGAPVSGVKVTAKGDKKTDKVGFAGFDNLDKGNYTVTIDLGTDLPKRYLPPAGLSKAFDLAEAEVKLVDFVLDRKTRLRVKAVDRDDPSKLYKDLSVKVEETGSGKKEVDKSTKDSEAAAWDPIPAGTYKVTLELSAEDAKRLKLDGDASRTVPLGKGADEELVFKLVPILRVYLKLQFNDPDAPTDDGKARPFPSGMKVRLRFDKDKTLDVAVGKDGLVSTGSGQSARAYVEIERVSKWLTLEFPADKKAFVVCEKRGAAAAAPELVLEDDANAEGTPLAARLGKEQRVFRLPAAPWNLKTADWKALDGSATPANYSDGKFKELDDEAKKVGAEAQPVRLILDAHWQYLRFEYFDRFSGHAKWSSKPVTVLPLLLEGYAKQQKDNATPTADELTTQSNWTLGDNDRSLVQCLPWIVRREDSGTALNKPDRDSTLRFVTHESRRFIHTGDSTRELVAKLDENHAKRHDKPSVDRLRYYDLPEEWRSTCYFSRLSDDAADQDLWEELATKETKKDKPLVFSLDDMVLTDHDLVPIAWHYQKPEDASNPNDRVAIFSHKFKGPDWTAGKSAPALLDAAKRSTWVPAKPQVRTDRTKPELSPDGLYLHETADERGYLSAVCMPWNYIADYPDWTRLVIAQGNLHDVFDRRTLKAKNTDSTQPVGARAAVRWVESATAGHAPGNSVSPRPGASFHPSGAAEDARLFVTQPLFEQRFVHPHVHVTRGNDSGIGRLDPAVLRCTDIDGNKENAVVVLFTRVCYAYDVPPANGLTEAQFAGRNARSVADRWNGRDGIGAATELLPKDSAVKLGIRLFFFLQVTPEARAHLRYKIVGGSGRAFCSSADGTGALSPGEYQPTGEHISPDSYTAAHEYGHFTSQPDDYGERWSHGSYDQLDWTNILPGLPFDDDKSAMMRANLTPRGRSFWFAAEWTRKAIGVELKVKNGTDDDFWLPPHPAAPTRSYTGWPYHSEHEQDVGDKSKFDLYLYPLGKDKTANDVFPTLTGSGGTVFDGVLSVVIKLRWNLFTDDHNFIRAVLSIVDQHVRQQANAKFYATGKRTVDGTERQFQRCLIQFQLRHLVNNFSGTANWGDFQDDPGCGGATGAQKYADHVNYIDQWSGPMHFGVELVQQVSPPAPPEWGSPPEFFFLPFDFNDANRDDVLREQFYQKFRAMLGLVENNDALSAADLKPIVLKILTDGDAHAV